MIDHEKIIQQQIEDQEFAAASSLEDLDLEVDDTEVEELIQIIKNMEDSYEEEQYFERRFSLKGIKVA